MSLAVQLKAKQAEYAQSEQKNLSQLTLFFSHIDHFWRDSN